MFFFETIYRVDPRGKSFSPDNLASIAETEYYQINIDVQFQGSQELYFVREKHGFFDDQRKKIAHHLYTLNPEEGFTNVGDALARYDKQLKYLASQGFVHAFSVRIPEGGTNHRVLDPGAESLLPAR